MKDFILDSTYKDAVIVNSNDDIFIAPSNKLPYNPQSHHTINLIETNPSHCSNNKNDKFNAYNIIDYL